jgi:hypothetical protein
MARAALAERVAVVLMMWAAVSTGTAARPGAGPHVYLSDSAARGAVERAIVGAQFRMGRPDCRQVLDDFTDHAGRPLRENLEATGFEPRDYMVAGVWFVDGSGTSQCANAPATVAYTEAGSKVVHVCAARFAKLAQQATSAEILVIHELLHTLGLGENPLSSAEITRRVTARCGAS